MERKPVDLPMATPKAPQTPRRHRQPRGRSGRRPQPGLKACALDGLEPFDAVPMAFSRAGGKVPENPKGLAFSFRLRGPFRHAELVERPLVVPPVGIRLARRSEYLRLEEPFEILPRLGADALDHLAADGR